MPAPDPRAEVRADAVRAARALRRAWWVYLGIGIVLLVLLAAALPATPFAVFPMIGVFAELRRAGPRSPSARGRRLAPEDSVRLTNALGFGEADRPRVRLVAGLELSLRAGLLTVGTSTLRCLNATELRVLTDRARADAIILDVPVVARALNGTTAVTLPPFTRRWLRWDSRAFAFWAAVQSLHSTPPVGESPQVESAFEVGTRSQHEIADGRCARLTLMLERRNRHERTATHAARNMGQGQGRANAGWHLPGRNSLPLLQRQDHQAARERFLGLGRPCCAGTQASRGERDQRDQ